VKDSSIRIIGLDEKNVDDALKVCTIPSVRDEESFRKGCEIRKKWLTDLYKSLGPCAKIAYIGDKPVGVIQYTPLHAIPYFRTKRKDALYIHCIYVPKRYRKRGIGSALLDSLTNEMSRPNKLFGDVHCNMLVTSARKIYGFPQVGLFMHKGFRRIKGNADVGLVLLLSNSIKDIKLGIPPSKPKTMKERGVKIFFKPTCQYCKHTNEKMIAAKIREVNRELTIEEYDLWACAQEAVRRRITCVATYVNGKPILPMPPRKFLETLKRTASEPNIKSPSMSELARHAVRVSVCANRKGRAQ
jgi:GNAT superfamily N-acetyltransferase